MSTNAKSLKSTQILDDCQRSLDLLEQVPDGGKQLFCIYWTFCLVALRWVRDVLEKYDSVEFPNVLFNLGGIYLSMGDSDIRGGGDCRDWLKGIAALVGCADHLSKATRQ
ncbi:MAG: hypothetical protein J6U40_06980 [Kiritimatiellae bacterium]|nr:hypothetical protein [Kiritimatiellia bacterium]